MNLKEVSRTVLEQELMETQERYEAAKKEAEKYRHLWSLRSTDMALLQSELEKWRELYAPREESQDSLEITPERAKSSWDVCIAASRTLIGLVDALASEHPALQKRLSNSPMINSILDRLRNPDSKIFLGDFSWRANLPADGE